MSFPRTAFVSSAFAAMLAVGVIGAGAAQFVAALSGSASVAFAALAATVSTQRSASQATRVIGLRCG